MWNTEMGIGHAEMRDGVFATVTGGCRIGLFLRLENGEEAFCRFCGLPAGTRVFCTVLKPATETWRVLVEIDSVVSDECLAA